MRKDINYRLSVEVPENMSGLFISSISDFNVSVAEIDRFRVPFDESRKSYDFSFNFKSYSLGDADKIMRICNKNHLLYGFTPILVK